MRINSIFFNYAINLRSRSLLDSPIQLSIPKKKPTQKRRVHKHKTSIPNHNHNHNDIIVDRGVNARTWGFPETTVTQSLQPWSFSSLINGRTWTATLTQQSSSVSMTKRSKNTELKSNVSEWVNVKRRMMNLGCSKNGSHFVVGVNGRSRRESRYSWSWRRREKVKGRVVVEIIWGN